MSPGTRLRAERVLTHRLRRGAEMQTPAVSCELRALLRGTCTCTATGTHRGCPRGPEMRLSASSHLRQFVTVPPQAAGGGLAQPTPSETVGCVAGGGRDSRGAVRRFYPTELPREPGVFKKDPASPFHFPAENIWWAWHLCRSKYSRASCSRARCHRDRWVRAQAAKRPCISIKCVC